MTFGYRASFNAVQAGGPLRAVQLPRTASRSWLPPARNRSIAQQTRNFHPSRPSHDLITPCIESAHALLQGVHSFTGLPWVASIPLTAVLVRSVTSIPMQYYSVAQRNKRARLVPALRTWAEVEKRRTAAKLQENGDRLLLGSELTTAVQFNIRQSDLFERHGVRPWASYLPLLQLPVWLSFMESMRAMVGWDAGLFGKLHEWLYPGAAKAQIPVDASLSTEGMLWFNDLIAPDMYYILPLTLSATMFTSVTWGWKPDFVNHETMAFVRLILQIVAITVGPVFFFSEIPAALLVYWIFSSATAIIQSQLLKRFMPLPDVPKPCDPVHYQRTLENEPLPLKRSRKISP
ncbi:hypothetical protein FQN55_002311 [Onygenales sp. PD_40]|nr:hypothetical protein FQN55_002311 [Onygenales sp. PD_40]KAK2781905.1 hypothetical protein FQN52_001306 [Onygenales sp. PD_12]